MKTEVFILIRELNKDEELPMELLLLADPSEKLVREYVSRGKCFIMNLNGLNVGTYVLIPTRPETVEIVNVAVNENYHGQGYGKQLILHAIETAKREGYKTIEIGTGNSGVVQLALYQKCGFRMTSIDRDFFIRHYDEPIFENGIQVIDMVRLSQDL
ncbi:GNAT family N-acetyltransferase [Robertmurraya andreesenii]|uniref:Ribosomal protein S18 acetylase RimI-like enzyme n=1 Tax=Anoxybacillus andreesenii TaxID=1325932 RepID=A0ABT9V9Z8_9BACL|nr:GNAT family N-acetyltransferase [Robertmurraya andreesenii]MDQ0157620.1 ribosomal protein S18 acetylase RimI-like enzyme [Robertmurraya andreesenii]